MPGEVFAEDIEALLERLDGVTSARVVANEAGEIDSVYVTATADRDESAVRRMVGSALMSRFSLPIDGWRVRVARLLTESPAQTWHPRRVEEVLAGPTVRVVVELESTPGSGRVLVGRARALPDRANRLRGVALATLDALKPVFDEEERRAALESMASVPLIGREAVVVAISIGSATETRWCVGAAPVAENEADAVIAATLDAAGKRGARPQRWGWTMKDRRDELESMRAHYRRLREPQRQMPAMMPEAKGDDEPADVVADLSQIRPERPGGTPVAPQASQEAGARPEQAQARPRGSMEDEYLRHLMTTNTPVHIRCRDGYEIPEAIVKDFGTYSLLLEGDGGRELVFKHGIISIRPLRAGNHLKT